MKGVRPGRVQNHLDRENELLGQRTSWVVASQAFLLSAYANCIVGSAHVGPATASAGMLRVVTRVIPWTGILSLLGISASSAAALLAIQRLWRELLDGDPPAGSVMRAAGLRWAGLAGAICVPVVFLMTWVVLLINAP